MKEFFWQIITYLEAACWLCHKLPLYAYMLMVNGYKLLPKDSKWLQTCMVASPGRKNLNFPFTTATLVWNSL